MKSKRIAIYIVIISIFLVKNVLGQIKDVEGWRQARWGMTETQLLEVFRDEAVRLPKVEKYQNWFASIGINKIKIGNDLFNVKFLMDDYKKTLKQINIKPINEDHASISQFDSLKKMLVQKYGQPSFDNDRKGSGIGKLEAIWNYPTTVIELSYLDFIIINTQTLVVIYREKDKGVSDKL